MMYILFKGLIVHVSKLHRFTILFLQVTMMQFFTCESVAVLSVVLGGKIHASLRIFFFLENKPHFYAFFECIY